MKTGASVALVIGAAFLFWGSAPRLVTYFLLLIILVLVINKWGVLKTYIVGGSPTPFQQAALVTTTAKAELV